MKPVTVRRQNTREFTGKALGTLVWLPAVAHLFTYRSRTGSFEIHPLPLFGSFWAGSDYAKKNAGAHIQAHIQAKGLGSKRGPIVVHRYMVVVVGAILAHIRDLWLPLNAATPRRNCQGRFWLRSSETSFIDFAAPVVQRWTITPQYHVVLSSRMDRKETVVNVLQFKQPMLHSSTPTIF
ncbi:hypothetical protein ZHAS_00011623 [Anopheles sinensis]|uniref:Uncharacterized protein n=1 Tax=Anopheles sinensis TaxID=74873 RepID=A0A084W0Z5_ANOSI|nr:hypothetical protein ZHAS_00011623 [Anopheles sinensis]